MKILKFRPDRQPVFSTRRLARNLSILSIAVAGLIGVGATPVFAQGVGTQSVAPAAATTANPSNQGSLAGADSNAGASGTGVSGNSTTQTGSSSSGSTGSSPACTTTAAGRGTAAASPACQTVVKPESDLYNALEKDPKSIKSLEFLPPSTVEVTLVAGTPDKYDVYVTDDADMQSIRELAIQKNVPFQSQQPAAQSGGSTDGSVIALWVILVLVGIAVLIRYLIKRNNAIQAGMNGTGTTGSTGTTTAASGGGIMSSGGGIFGSQRKQAQTAPAADPNRVTFADVIGQDEAKKKLMGIVRYLQNPERLQKIGAKVPKGILLYGDPGEGKTLLARAAAGEAGVPFFQISGSDFLEMYVGVGAQRVRGLFAKARAVNGPAIVFIDEIDAIGKKRESSSGSHGDSEREQTLNALLVEMDGFKQSQHPIIVMAATNLPAKLDKALLRPGRFSRKVQLTPPKAADLKKLFLHYTKDLALADDIDFDALVKKSLGLSAASIAEICNEAGLALFDDASDDEPGEESSGSEKSGSDNSGSQQPDVITQEMLEAQIVDAIKSAVTDSKAKRFHNGAQSIKLDDVIGQDLAKDDVKDVVNFLKDPDRFIARGAKVPRGTLFVGGPGEGKTLLARAVAGEADVPFFSISGSDFVEVFVGVGAQRVRELFEEAKRHAPSIVFIDEIDAVGKKRSMNAINSNDEREQTLNALLVEMDGFDVQSEPVIVFAATNRVDVLDDALLRPGRFDRQATFYKPDVADRLKLFRYHMQDKKLSQRLDLDHFAHNTAGYSGADIAKVCNEAAVLLTREDGDEITPELLDEAMLRAQMGAARTNRIMSEKEKRNTAVHEGGHAVCHYVASGYEPIARITIMPRANSGGHVQTMNDDKFFYTRDELLTRIVMALGGRAAQEVVLGVTDTGASSDFKQARNIAYQFVTEYGMSDLGVLTSIDGVERSDEEKDAISREVKKILDECDLRARQIISDNRERFDQLVEVLMVQETILGPDFARFWEEGPSALSATDAAAASAVAAAATEPEEANNESDGGSNVVDARDLFGSQPGRRPRGLRLPTVKDVQGGIRKALAGRNKRNRRLV